MQQVRSVIDQAEKAKTLRDLAQMKPLEGHKGMYRIRVGRFRLGLFWTEEQLEFVRFMDRKEIYRYFP